GVLRVGHEPDDVPGGVGHRGDVVERPVRVDALVALHHAALALELVQRAPVGDEAALAVLQRDGDDLADLVAGGPGGVVVLHPQLLVAADEALVVVADEGTGQQVGLAQDLEAVADAQDRQPTAGGLDDGLHHRGEAGDGAAAQVVAVGEPAGQDDGVHAPEVGVGVPQRHRLGTGEPDRTLGVPVVERAGEGDDTDAGAVGSHLVLGVETVHHSLPASSTAATRTTFSITGLDRSISAARRAWSRAASSTSPSTSSSKRLPCRTETKPSRPRRGRAPATALP